MHLNNFQTTTKNFKIRKIFHKPFRRSKMAWFVALMMLLSGVTALDFSDFVQPPMVSVSQMNNTRTKEKVQSSERSPTEMGLVG